MKKFILGFAFAVMAGVANAGWLFWDIPETTSGSDALKAAEEGGWDGTSNIGMRVVGSDGSTLNIYWGDGSIYEEAGQTQMVSRNIVEQQSYAMFAGEIADPTGATYYVELVNFTKPDEVYARSEGWSYADKPEFFVRTLDVFTPPTPWSPKTYTPVPEPTSGLLALVGFALLGLRRKKAA